MIVVIKALPLVRQEKEISKPREKFLYLLSFQEFQVILRSKKRYHGGTTSKITLDPDKDKDKDHLEQFLSKGRIHL